MNKLSSITRAYAAGFIDGEGYLGITMIRKGNYRSWDSKYPVKFRAEVNVTNTNKEVIEWFKDHFDGYMDSREHKKNRKKSYAWEARKTNQCESIIRIVYPWLRIKLRQADILKEFFETFKEENRGRKGVKRGETTTTKAIFDKRARLYWEIRKLNMRGIDQNALETTRQELLSLGVKI